MEYIDFVSEIPWEKMEILLKLGEEFGFDPSASIESERYFTELVSRYRIDDNIIEKLREDIKRDFKFIEEKPRWVQNPEWQFNNGKPMKFVGQLEIKHSKIRPYDEMVFYLFWDKEEGITKTIIQSA